jgi:histidine triad (HIT) family protein
MSCLFCRIAVGEIPANKVYEDDRVVAFCDIAPQAPTHIIVIPREHIPSMSHVNAGNAALIGHVFAVIAELAKAPSFAGGYRVVSNCGADAGQTVEHIHFHLLAGRELAWPPG